MIENESKYLQFFHMPYIFWCLAIVEEVHLIVLKYLDIMLKKQLSYGMNKKI